MSMEVYQGGYIPRKDFQKLSTPGPTNKGSLLCISPPTRKDLPRLKTDWTVMSTGLCFCYSGAVH
eukprot:scaffold13299_cov71-Cylindrotheca_fusiformis.AAC.2